MLCNDRIPAGIHLGRCNLIHRLQRHQCCNCVSQLPPPPLNPKPLPTLSTTSPVRVWRGGWRSANAQPSSLTLSVRCAVFGSRKRTRQLQSGAADAHVCAVAARAAHAHQMLHAPARAPTRLLTPLSGHRSVRAATVRQGGGRGKGPRPRRSTRSLAPPCTQLFERSCRNIYTHTRGVVGFPRVFPGEKGRKAGRG